MRRCPSYRIRLMPEAARNEPVPVRLFLWKVGLQTLRFLFYHLEWALR